MILTSLDWLVIVLYFVLSLIVGFIYTRRAGESAEEYFLCAIVYLGLFGTGQLVLGRPWRGALLVAVALVLTVWIVTRAESAEPE